MAHVEFCEPVGHVGVSDSGAALFWRRCNEVGCTEDIFTELTRQLTCLAERVQNRHATQQGVNRSYLFGLLFFFFKLATIV